MERPRHRTNDRALIYFSLNLDAKQFWVKVGSTREFIYGELKNTLEWLSVVYGFLLIHLIKFQPLKIFQKQIYDY